MTEVAAGAVSAGGGGWRNDGNSLSSLVHDFLGLASVDPDDDDSVDAKSPAGVSDSRLKHGSSDVADKARKAAERVRTLLDQAIAADPLLQRLTDDVAKAVEETASLRSSWPAFRRAVASRLSEGGYDAGVCQTRWQRTEEVSAGNYEFIDVVIVAPGKKEKRASTSERRYIVDVGFPMEYAVARPTPEYTMLFDALPTVLVAQPKVVQKVVRVAAKAARRSLKSQGLIVPPWRKKRFMAAKWLGPYLRSPDTAMAPRVAASEATCPIVGFVLRPSAVPPCLSYALQ
jgi:uncharacterized protein (TIGR01615 family)